MKYFFLFFVFISCQKTTKVINFCDINNSIYQIRLKENPGVSKPLIVDVMNKIDDPIIENYLLSNSKKFKSYNFNEYFIKANTFKEFDFKCDTIDYESFNNEYKLSLNSNKAYANLFETKYIKFYQPIFNGRKDEFLLFFEEFEVDFKCNFRLCQYYFLNGKIELKKELLFSI